MGNHEGMNQRRLLTGFERGTKRTAKQQFLEEMLAVVPWDALVAQGTPHAPAGLTGRPPYPVLMLLRIHFLQQWFSLSDEGVEDALHDVQVYRAFAGIDLGATRIPDATTVLRFQRSKAHGLASGFLTTINAVLEAKGLLLRRGTAVDATIAHAPSSTKNPTGARDPEMHQTRKGNQWFSLMKAHIGTDVASGLVHTVVVHTVVVHTVVVHTVVVHTVVGTPANTHDLTVAGDLLHGGETDIHADAGSQGAVNRGIAPEATWHIAMRPGKRRVLEAGSALALAERVKAQVRARVEHPFRVVKRQFGYVKVRYRGLAKNTAPVTTLFALSNLWMVRHTVRVG